MGHSESVFGVRPEASEERRALLSINVWIIDALERCR